MIKLKTIIEKGLYPQMSFLFPNCLTYSYLWDGCADAFVNLHYSIKCKDVGKPSMTPITERQLKHEEMFSLQAFVFPRAKQSTE
jgi:hypothetical protein